MSDKPNSSFRIRDAAWTLVAILVSLAIGVAAMTDLPERIGFRSVAAPAGEADATHSGDALDGPDHEGHDHEGHDDGGDSARSEVNLITLTPQARDNLGLQTQVVSTSSFTQYVSMPARIMDWPGRTHVSVAAPLTGIVNAIYVTRGELIRSGQPLFRLRLTHQDLVMTQSNFLASLGRMDVEDREITRLQKVAQSGAIAGKTLIQREYERDKLLAELRAQRQAMLLHGLSESQVAEIERTRTLVQEVTVRVPSLHDDDSLHHATDHRSDSGDAHDHPSDDVGDPPLPPGATPTTAAHQHVEADFLVTELNVDRGQSVDAGQPLCRLSDYSQVLIEGHAFQRDAKALRIAASLRLPLQAVIDSTGSRPEIIDNLAISYIGNEVELDSRALPFFVPLENRVERSEQRGDSTYVSWRFKPGQRLQIRVPLQSLDDTIVVPREAVAEEGAERYVFLDHGDHFDRRAVRVLARDAISVAIANDGSISSGQKIAASGAHQLQMAMKKKAGGPVDPHAGHSH